MGDPLSSITLPTRPPDAPEPQPISGHTDESATVAPTGAATDSGEQKPAAETPVDAELEERKRREEEERLERKKVPCIQHSDTYLYPLPFVCYKSESTVKVAFVLESGVKERVTIRRRWFGVLKRSAQLYRS